jgi:hypothetical protein
MFFVLDFIAHYLLHVSAPIGGHLQVERAAQRQVLWSGEFGMILYARHVF